jgi:hypothetical protein
MNRKKMKKLSDKLYKNIFFGLVGIFCLLGVGFSMANNSIPAFVIFFVVFNFSFVVMVEND